MDSRPLPLVEAHSLYYTYPSSSSPAISGVDLVIPRGDYVALVGPNGSGKSSLLRLMAGLRKPSSGRILVGGLEASDPQNARLVRRSLGLVFQAPLDQIVSSVVEEDVAFGPENLGLGREEIRSRVSAALEAVGLSSESASPSLFLSTGQQQRLAIAGALALEPDCLAFDEATAMLDPEGRLAVLALMDRLSAQGLTLIHATHDMEEASRALRVVVLGAGRIVYDGSPEGLFLPSGPGRQVLAPSLGLGLPPSVEAALALGLEARLGETARGLAGRIQAASLVPRAASPAREPAPLKDIPAQVAFSLENASLLRLKGTALERLALDSVSLDIRSGRHTALVGRTGSGKSSLLELLDALAFPSSGRVKALGQDSLDPATDIRALRMKAPLAIQRPEAALFEPYAGDDVAFGPRNKGLSGSALVATVKAAMGALGLDYEAWRDRGTRCLSGGEKRRLALAGVLAMEGEALLLDEPTSALDPQNRALVRGLLSGPGHRASTLVLSTHSMDEAAMCDTMIVLDRGRVLASGPPSRLFHEDFDPAWGLVRPFACEVAAALGDLGLSLASRPLDIPGLASALGPAPSPEARP